MPRPFLASLATAFLLAGCDAAPDAPVAAPETGVPVESAGKLDRSHAGEPAPDLAFEDPDGAPVRLAEFGGKPLLVNLWATWCAPCIAEMPTLDALAADRAGELRVLTISEDFQGAEVVGPFFAERDFDRLEQWLDPENAMMATLGLDSLPVTILYDESGRELFRVYGGMDWSGERAERLIDGALGN